MANTKKSDELVNLKQQVAELTEKNQELEKSMRNSKKTTFKKSNWRKPVIWICVVFATLLLVFSNIFFWTSRTIVDTNRFVATVGPVIQQPAVQSGIAQY